MRITVAAIIMVLITGNAFADDAIVEKAAVKYQGNDKFSFSITLRHNDTGWEHYADRCQILDPDGNVLGTLTLAHPHVDEQPFTRKISGVTVPKGINQVTLRAQDSEFGESEQVLIIDLPARE